MVRPKILQPGVLGLACAGLLVAPPLYQRLGEYYGKTHSILDIYSYLSLVVLAAFAGYEIFFRVQSAAGGRKARVIHSRLDDRIPFVVEWVWIYGLFYYVLIFLPTAFFDDLQQCLVFVGGGLLMLLLSVPVFYFWPSRCPSAWRRYETHGLSARYLMFIQRLDLGRCCFPSLHCMLSAYAATFVPSRFFGVAIPALVSLSCLLVKQHSILDLPASILIGFLLGLLTNMLLISHPVGVVMRTYVQ